MNTTLTGFPTREQSKAWITRQREAHHAALKAMLPASDKTSGLELWRRLRRLEIKASDLATRLCNGEINEGVAEANFKLIECRVKNLFGGTLPNGFFINRDPRGYALKLEQDSVPFHLHQDMGRYQILAPTIP